MAQVLYKKEIEDIKSSGYLKRNRNITDALIENFYNEILKDNEKKLLKLAFSNRVIQEDLDELLKIWDIEVKGSAKSLMLAYIMKMHPDMKFTAYEEPRLQGLLKFYRYKNLDIISHYGKICRALNNAGITPLILKGGAMKYLRPELPRVMGDIDILVPEKDFMKSANVASELGYTYSKVDIHAIDLHKPNTDEGVLDIHKFIYMETRKEKNFLSSLYKRARLENVFGTQSFVPSNEDLMFIALVNLAKNLRNKTSQAGLIFTLFDCKYLQETKPDFDWNIIKENAIKTGTEVQLNFAMKFLMKIADDIFPKSISESIFFEKETIEYSNMVMFNRFYMEDLRSKCRSLKLGSIFTDWDVFKNYIRLKPKYFLLKQLIKHPKLIEFCIKDLDKTYES